MQNTILYSCKENNKILTQLYMYTYLYGVYVRIRYICYFYSKGKGASGFQFLFNTKNNDKIKYIK